MSFKRNALFSLLLMLLVAFATSCEEDNLQIDPETPGSVNVQAQMDAVMGRALPPSDTSAMDEGDLCFVFNFPLSFVLENGETVTFENEDDLADGMLEGLFIADFVYPFTVTLSDGTESTIDAFEGILAVLTTCYGDFDDWDDDDDWDDHDGDCPGDYDFDADFFCFDFVYPISFSGPDSTVIVVDSEDGFFDLLDSLDGQDLEVFDFVFPFSVITSFDSSQVVINNYEDLDAVFEACFDFGDWDDHDWDDWGDDVFTADCYVPTFPLTLLINDEEVVLESPDGFGDIDVDFSDPDLSIELAFPLTTLELATGETVVFDTKDEYLEALESCDGHYDDGDFDWDFGGFGSCFTIDFPLTLILDDETVTVADEEGLIAIFNDVDEDTSIEIGFPLTVTLLETGEVLTINSEEELDALADVCDDDADEVDFDVDCLTFNFPVEVELEGQGIIPIADLEQLVIIFNAADGLDAEINFVFPLSVNLTDVGETVVVNNEEELEAILAACDE